jgi:hypothetical protein
VIGGVKQVALPIFLLRAFCAFRDFKCVVFLREIAKNSQQNSGNGFGYSRVKG